MHKQKAVLILGVFVGEKSEKQNIRSAEDRIAAMLRHNNIAVISSSSAAGRAKRFVHHIYTIISKRKAYDVAVVPLFGTTPAFILQEMITRLLKVFGKKIVLGIHGGSIQQRVEQGANRFYTAMNRADLLYAPSGYFGTYFKEKGYKIHIIENPVELSVYRFCPKKNIRPRILWMRAFSDIYNPLMAVRVAKRLAEKYSDFEMVMAGKEGPLSHAVKSMSKEIGLGNKIVFPGYINVQQKQAFAEAYDIYICTNKIDNTPVSFTEFMQLGLPIVSVNIGGIPFMLQDGLNGLMVNDDDDEAMFHKIDMLINNNSLAQSIIANAYDYVQQYDEVHVMKKWDVVLKELNVL